MPRLVLFRHAEAARPAGVGDLDRPLSERGRRDAAAMGQALAERGLQPDAVVVSPALRTRETWSIAAQNLKTDATIRLEPGLYETSAEDQLSAILRELDPAETVMLVAHNPGLEDLARLLVAASDLKGLAQLRDGMRTAAVAILDVDATPWRAIKPACARLEALLLPPEG